MADAKQVVKRLCKAAGSDPRVDLRHLKIDYDPASGIATFAGEVPNAATKRLALRRAGRVPAVTRVVDRLRVRPAERLGDGALRDLVRDSELTLAGMLRDEAQREMAECDAW